MTVQRVQLIQKNIDKLLDNITETSLRQATENVKSELQTILGNETEGTGSLAESMQVQLGTQRGKRIVRILGAEYARPFFKGTSAPYSGFPPSPASAGRFNAWADIHSFRPRRLSRIIALGKSSGKVYSDRTNILIRALRTGFRI